jgi:diguanylate cyclase (GGDEF)-like protein
MSQITTRIRTRIPSMGLSTMRRSVRMRIMSHAPAGRTVMIGAAVAAGLAVAVPLTRAAARTAGRRWELRRSARGDQRALDPLTGLPNHAEAVWWLNRRMEQARARRMRLAVLVLDLDDFADCNEAYGRAAGDHVLQVTGVRLQALLRTGDIVCRTGNDTFVVIMDVEGPDHMVARIGERVVQAVAEPITFGEDTIVMRSSVGFAISTDREADPELLLGRADRAVIQAKASERPIVQF